MGSRESFSIIGEEADLEAFGKGLRGVRPAAIQLQRLTMAVVSSGSSASVFLLALDTLLSSPASCSNLSGLGVGRWRDSFPASGIVSYSQCPLAMQRPTIVQGGT